MEIDFDKLDPPAKTESGVLAVLFRKIWRENRFRDYFDILLNRYIEENDISAGRSKNVKRKTKSTIVSNLTATEMTFKTFIDLLFNFIKIKKLTITVKLTFQSGSETLHTVVVNGENIQRVNDITNAVEEARKEASDGGQESADVKRADA